MLASPYSTDQASRSMGTNFAHCLPARQKFCHRTLHDTNDTHCHQRPCHTKAIHFNRPSRLGTRTVLNLRHPHSQRQLSSNLSCSVPNLPPTPPPEAMTAAPTRKAPLSRPAYPTTCSSRTTPFHALCPSKSTLQRRPSALTSVTSPTLSGVTTLPQPVDGVVPGLTRTLAPTGMGEWGCLAARTTCPKGEWREAGGRGRWGGCGVDDAGRSALIHASGRIISP